VVGHVRPGCRGGSTRQSEWRVHPSCARWTRCPSGIGAGQGGSVSLMSAAAVPESITIPVAPEQVVRAARAFAAGVLGESRTQAYAALLANETPRTRGL
jgi:hypothetical protein